MHGVRLGISCLHHLVNLHIGVWQLIDFLGSALYTVALIGLKHSRVVLLVHKGVVSYLPVASNVNNDAEVIVDFWRV